MAVTSVVIQANKQFGDSPIEVAGSRVDNGLNGKVVSLRLWTGSTFVYFYVDEPIELVKLAAKIKEIGISLQEQEAEELS